MFLSKKDEVKYKKTFTFKSMYSENTEWLKEYEFSYNNVNQDGIMKIFG
jgi:hypothetical protein